MAWAPSYVSADELAAYVRIPDSADDTEIDYAIAAASRAIDKATNRQFGRTVGVEARYYTARKLQALGMWSIKVDDLMPGATEAEVSFDTDGDLTWSDEIDPFLAYPLNAAAEGCPWTRLLVPKTNTVQPTDASGAVRVVAQWGWDAVPVPVVQACLMQASRLLSRRDSPYGVAGSPEAGNELRLLAKLDPDVEVTLAAYKRPRDLARFA
jgi:hypothetical protein